MHSHFNNSNDQSEYYFDHYPGQGYPDRTVADRFDLYQAFLLRVPSHGRILNAGGGYGSDTAYFRRHGYDVRAIDASLDAYRWTAAVTRPPVLNMGLETAHWESVFDGIWAFGTLEELPQEYLHSVLEKLRQALTPNGVILACIRRWGMDWEASAEYPGCNAVNLLRLIRKHPYLLLDAIWESDCGLSIMLLRR